MGFILLRFSYVALVNLDKGVSQVGRVGYDLGLDQKRKQR